MEKLITKETSVDGLLERTLVLSQQINEMTEAADSLVEVVGKLRLVSFKCNKCNKSYELEAVVEAGHSLCCSEFMIAEVSK